MSEFKKVLGADGTTFMQEFSEQVVYLPDGGAARTIRAIVDRNPTEGISEAPGNLAPFLVIVVRNSATLGISSAEFNKTRDQIRLEVRIGKPVEDRLITELIEHDDGICRFEVR